MIRGVFYRKQRAALNGFHPVHRTLVEERATAVTLRPADTDGLIRSFAAHAAAIRRRRWRLPERVPGVLVPLMRVLAADMRADAPLGVAVDFRGPKAPGKEGPAIALPVRLPYLSVRQWFAFDPWLRMRAELRDGGALELAVVDRVRFRRIKKNSSRGKIKIKTKSKTVRLVTVSRRLPKGAVLTRPATPPPGWIAVRVKEGSRPVVRVRARLPESVEGPELVRRTLLMTTETFRWTAPQPRRSR
ncbi:hypothetical protein [Actinomadura atramentaria]|uniref:hypothetical protein n=1 Tax=Actinomadura atramentaria TaxID=1990 RepID=UPI001F0A320E|nr:hypothetical protein [Actinomadura atramentaria]